MINNIHKAYILLANQNKKLPTIMIMFIVASFIDLVGIGLVAPYVGFILDDNWQSVITQSVNQFFLINLNQQEIVLLLGALILIFFFFRLVVAVSVNGAIIGFAELQRLRLKMTLLKMYQNMDIQVAARRNSAEYAHLIHVLTGHYSGNVLFFILKITSEVLISSIIIIFLAYKNIYLVLLLLSLLSFIVGGYDYSVKSQLKIIGKKINDASIKALAKIRESIDGFKEIRILEKGNNFLEMVEDNSHVIYKHTKKGAIISSVPRYLLEFTIFAFIILACTFSYVVVDSSNEFIETMVLFGAAAVRLVPSATLMAHGLTVIRANGDSVNLLYEDFIETYKNDYEDNPVDQKIIDEFRLLSLKNIDFYYENNALKVIDNLSFDISSGSSIGIIGASGSGKSTLIDIILGMLEPQKGSISINHTPLNLCKKSWQRKVAFIPQEIFLIDGSFEANITLEFDPENIDKIMLSKAIRMASLKDLVSSLPQGTKTIVNENGVNFSGGQRQRIALARAFYHKRDFLIMDEATSALDSNTEKEIVSEVTNLKEKVTTIIIAHRLTTVKHCDYIIELDKGSVLREGLPGEILGN